MEFRSVVASRRMVRSFADRSIPADVLDRVLSGVRGEVVVLDETAPFWGLVSEPEWRRQPTWPGLLRAPVVVLPMAGGDVAVLVDASFDAMVILLAAVDAGLGALFFRIRRGEDALLEAQRVPAGRRPIGAIALGWPDREDRPSSSVARGRRPVEAMVHRGRW